MSLQHSQACLTLTSQCRIMSSWNLQVMVVSAATTNERPTHGNMQNCYLAEGDALPMDSPLVSAIQTDMNTHVSVEVPEGGARGTGPVRSAESVLRTGSGCLWSRMCIPTGVLFCIPHLDVLPKDRASPVTVASLFCLPSRFVPSDVI